MLSHDITMYISQFMNVKELVNYILTSKSNFSMKKLLINNHSLIRKFEDIYGNNTYFKTLFHSTILFSPLQYSTNHSSKLHNTYKILSLYNTMLNLFQHQIKQDYRVSRSNEKKLQNVNEIFSKIITNHTNWNDLDLDIYVLYKIIYLVETNNYMEVFNIKYSSKDIHITPLQKQNNMINTLHFFMKIYNKTENTILKHSVMCILFHFISVNISFLNSIKNNKDITTFFKLIDDIFNAIKEFMRFHELPTNFKTKYRNYMEKSYIEFKTISQ